MLKINKKWLSNTKPGPSHAKRGFTLIELLIVIVIIGILAVLVLSTINPVEQRNKATDTALRSTSGELLNGIERYYASNGSYPWGNTPPGDGQPVNSADAWFEELVDSGEVKPEFRNREDLSELTLFYEASVGGLNLVKLCFIPVSQTFRRNNMKFDANGGYVGIQTDYKNYDGRVCVPE